MHHAIAPSTLTQNGMVRSGRDAGNALILAAVEKNWGSLHTSWDMRQAPGAAVSSTEGTYRQASEFMGHRHGPRRRTVHDFASAIPILPAAIQRCTTELVDGPPSWTMTSH
jgi:hypothetical protein